MVYLEKHTRHTHLTTMEFDDRLQAEDYLINRLLDQDDTEPTQGAGVLNVKTQQPIFMTGDDGTDWFRDTRYLIKE